MKRLTLVVGLVLAMVAGRAMVARGYYLDTPHNESNGIYCYTCHSLPYWWDFTPSGPDDTMRNAVCLQCHGAGSTDPHRGPVKKPHASSTTSRDKGDWSTECTQCHDVHSQGQLDWAGVNDSELFLAEGLFDSSIAPRTFTPADPQGGTFGATTIGIASVSGKAGWTDTATWGAKGGHMAAGRAVDQSRGLILVPNKANPTETFEIIGVSGGVLKVKGQMGSAPTGQTFGVIYGQSLRSSVMPNGGTTLGDYRDVKFFKPEIIAAQAGGYIDESGAAAPQGLCQVCHDATAFWRDDGSSTEHNRTSACSGCHDILKGLAGGADHRVFIGDRLASGCGACHAAQVAAPESGHPGGCNTCHVDPKPTITTTPLANEGGIPVATALTNGGYRFAPRLTDAAGKVVSDPGFVMVDCSECHEQKLAGHGGHEGSFGWNSNCVDCHGPAGREVVRDVHNNLCTLCHDPARVAAGDYTVRIAGATANGIDGSAVGATTLAKCTDCHNTNTPGVIHHDSRHGYAAAGDCSFCHATAGHQGNHTNLVAGYGNCTTCHVANVGSSSGAPVDPDDNKVHDRCLTCHNSNATLKAAGAVSPALVIAMPDGGAGSNNGGGNCTTCHGAYFLRHSKADHTAKVAMNANCSSCHEGTQGTPAGVPVDTLNNLVHDSCTTCHDGSDGTLVGLAAGHSGGGDCLTCHGGHDSNLVHNHRVTSGLATDCTACHAVAGAAAVDTLHGSCQTCHGYSGNRLEPATVAAVIAAGRGPGGSNQNCETCHTVNLHHTTSEAVNNSCTTTCHPSVNHSTRVAGNPACVTCHTGTAGSDTGVPLSLTDAAVHDSCRTCHAFDGQWRGTLGNFTNRKGVNGSGALPIGGGACTICHTLAANPNMANLGVLHHTSARVAQGQCEYCHEDPLPSWNANAPGDNGGLSGLTPAWPTQMACRECHVKFSGSAMTVTKFTRSDYANYAVDWNRTTAHTLPVAGSSINNYGICLGCHFTGSSKVPASAQVTLWHARPDKHGSSLGWAFYDQTSSGTLGKTNSRATCGSENVAYYAAGRATSGIGGFNLFAPNYGLYENPNGDWSYLDNGTSWGNDGYYEAGDCQDEVRGYLSVPQASAPFAMITLPAPLPQLGISSPQALPVFASLAPANSPPPAADVISITNAVWDGSNMNLTATTSGTCAELTAWSLPDNTNRGTMTGTSACSKSVPVATRPTMVNLVPADGVSVTFPVTDNSRLSVTSPIVTAIGPTGATLGATVSVSGGTTITSRGTVWGTSANPTDHVFAEGGSAPGPFTQARTGLPASAKIYFRGYATNSVGASFSSDGSFYTEPATQASGVSFSPVSSTKMTVNWSRGNGDGVLVLMRRGTAVTTDPADGVYTAYAANPLFGSGTPMGADSYVVYKGNGSSVTVTGLIASSTYSLALYEYKGMVDTAGVNQGTNYKLSPATGTQATTVAALPPTLTAPTATAILGTTATLGANVTSDGGAALSERGVVWGSSANPTGNAVSSGTTTGLFSQASSGLPASAKVYYRGYATNVEGTGYSPGGSFHTEASYQAYSLWCSAIGATSLAVNWYRGNGDGVIVLMRQGSAVNADPADGTYTSYTANSVFGSGTQIGAGNYVVYKGPASNVAVSGLTAGTTYYLAVYEYKGLVDTTGDNQGTNYKTPAATSTTVTASLPTLTAPTATGIAGSTATLGANVTSNGGATLSARGIVWGPSANPTGNGVSSGTATGVFTQAASGLPAGSKSYYRGYATNSVGTAYSPDGSFYTEPATQASGVSFTAVGATAMTVNWTRGNGNGVIVLMKAGSAVTAVPADGTFTAYAANPTFGLGTPIVAGNYVVYKGVGTSVTVTGLTAGTTYYLAVYEYAGSEDTSSVEQGTNYKTSPATGNQATTLTGSLPALTTPTATLISSTSATLGATVIADGGTSLSARGTVWGTSANPIVNPGAEGGTSTGSFTHARTGLTAGTKIFYRGYATNGGGTGYSPDGSFYTEPATQASGVSFSAIYSTAMTVNWARGNGDGVIVLMRQGAAVDTDPTDGIYAAYAANSLFAAGQQIGIGNYIVYKGSGTGVTVTGLTASTTYGLAVYEYQGTLDTSGVDQGTNYKSLPATATQTTSLFTPPPAAPVLSWPGSGYYGQVGFPAGQNLLQWNGSAGATEYYCEYGGAASGNSGWTTATSFDPGDLGDNNDYWWRVKARNADGESDWSATWTWYDYWDTSGGSCPFVYVWNGEKYEYLTDLQGAPVGYAASSYLAKFPPYYRTQYVVLDRPKPDGHGKYNIRVRETLPEISYFDEAKLLAIDYPAGYELVSSTAEMTYRFKYTNPFNLYSLKDPRPPLAVVDKNGSDVLASALNVDGNPLPMELFALESYTFDFGPLEPANAKLVIDGWSVFGTPYTTALEKVQPYIEVVDGNGQWVKVKTFGEPAGDLKRMAIDLSGLFLSDDHRVRLNPGRDSGMAWRIDKVMIDDSAPIALTISETGADSADLHHRGKAPYVPSTLNNRISSEDAVLSDESKSYGYGKFTKYGDVKALLNATDDIYAIMRHGDEISLTFPRPSAPPAAGMQRSFVLKSDVYYKVFRVDKNVEPLPFHEMSTYPYESAVEHYPDDVEHNRYRLDYNTREYAQ